MIHVTAVKCALTVIHLFKCGGLEFLVEGEVVTSRAAGHYLCNNCPIILKIKFLFCILHHLMPEPLAAEVKKLLDTVFLLTGLTVLRLQEKYINGIHIHHEHSETASK